MIIITLMALFADTFHKINGAGNSSPNERDFTDNSQVILAISVVSNTETGEAFF